MIHARISQLVFATPEPRAGMIVSQQDISEKTFYNHAMQIEHGLLAEQSQILLKNALKYKQINRNNWFNPSKIL